MYKFNVNLKVGDLIKLKGENLKTSYINEDGTVDENSESKIKNKSVIFEVLEINISIYLNEDGKEEISKIVQAIDITNPLGEYYVIDIENISIATDEDIESYEDNGEYYEEVSYFKEEGGENSTPNKISNKAEEKVINIDEILDEYNTLTLIKNIIGEEDQEIEDRLLYLKSEFNKGSLL